MYLNNNRLLSKSQIHVIFAVTFGNILEWYDLYLYIYWAPTISTLFFDQHSSSAKLINTIAFFALGFIFRPLGGIIFGRLGDHFGRRVSFLLSIVLMTIPTFALGFIPTYSQIGIMAPIILAIARILQTLPSGGELPGVFCYLYENANSNNRKFMSSFAGVGNQIGIALSTLECFLMDSFMPKEMLIHYGWRISFILGGFIGLFGLFLRFKLHETKLFQEAVHHKMIEKSIKDVIKLNWKKITTGICYGSAQTVSFHLISILFPLYIYKKMLPNNFVSSMAVIALITLPLPFFGYLGDKFGIKKMAICSCIAMPFLIYYSMLTSILSHKIFSGCLFVVCISCLTAFLPYLVSHLFHTSERYTCIGLSFNISDGVFGGLGLILSALLFESNGNLSYYVIFLALCCAISLVSFMKIKEQ